MKRVIFWSLSVAVAQARLYAITACDPSIENTSCPPNPGFGGNVTFDFAAPLRRREYEKFWDLDPNTQNDWNTVDVKTEGNIGAAFKVLDPLVSPTLSSKKYLMFGKINIRLQAAPGKGVITAIVLKSDSGNEIDWEMLGAFEKQAQTNYFFNGKPIYDQYADTYDLDFSTTEDFHTYTIEWTDKFLTFLIDGKKLKTWRNGDIPGNEWPQVPMQVKISVWATTEDSPPGEIEWAGGVPDFVNDAPFVAYYQHMEVQDFAAWCHGKTDDLTYDWDNGSGWEDVKVKGCERRPAKGHTPDGGETMSTSTVTENAPGHTMTITASTGSSTTSSDHDHVSSTESTDSPQTSTSEASEPTDDGDDESEDAGTSLFASDTVSMLIALLWMFAF